MYFQGMVNNPASKALHARFLSVKAGATDTWIVFVFIPDCRAKSLAWILLPGKRQFIHSSQASSPLQFFYSVNPQNRKYMPRDYTV